MTAHIIPFPIHKTRPSQECLSFENDMIVKAYQEEKEAVFDAYCNFAEKHAGKRLGEKMVHELIVIINDRLKARGLAG